MSEQANAVKVALIAGAQRSGSTVLARILGSQLAECATFGELWYFWRRGLVENWLCGCGSSFASCHFWRQVAERLPEDVRESATDIDGRIASAVRTRTMLKWVLEPGRTSANAQGAEQLLSGLGALYEAISSVSRAPVLIDSSKNPLYGALLAQVGSLDLRIVHLVRDPRGMTFSWARDLPQSDQPVPDARRGKMSVLKSTSMWALWNLGAEALRKKLRLPYIRLTYEHFVTDPQDTLSALGTFLGIESPAVNRSTKRFHLPAQHTVAGNPNRLQQGPIAIEKDEEWRSEMPAWKRLFVAGLTKPLLTRYDLARQEAGA